MWLNGATGVISGVLSFAASGASPYTVQVTVTDNGVPALDDVETFSWTVADVNRDGFPDLVLANRDGQPNAVYLNDSHLGFRQSFPFGTGRDETRAVAVAGV